MKKITLTLFTLILILLSSCSKTIMTIESPRSPEIEKELSNMLDELFFDEFESNCTYKDGTYTLKANRDLQFWEMKGLNILMKKVISAEGVQELPIHFQLHITETDQDVLDILKIEEGQTFDFEISSSEIFTTVTRYDQDEAYFIGVAIYCDKEFPLLQYETSFDTAENELATMFQEIYDKFGPTIAENEILIKNGEKIISLDESFDYIDQGVFFSCDAIYNRTVNEWTFGNDQEEILEGAKNFITSSGFSSNVISCLLYPYLSRDAASFEITGFES